MSSDQRTDIRATSVQRMPYNPVHSRAIAFTLKFTKNKDHKDKKLSKPKPLLASQSTNGAVAVVIDAAESAADLT